MKYIIGSIFIPFFISYITILITHNIQEKEKIGMLKITVRIMYEEVSDFIEYLEDTLIRRQFIGNYIFTDLDYKEIIYRFCNLKETGIINRKAWKFKTLYNILPEEPMSLIYFFEEMNKIKNIDTSNLKIYSFEDRKIKEENYNLYIRDLNFKFEKEYIYEVENIYKNIEQIFNNNYIKHFLNKLKKFISSEKDIKILGTKEINNCRLKNNKKLLFQIEEKINSYNKINKEELKELGIYETVEGLKINFEKQIYFEKKYLTKIADEEKYKEHLHEEISKNPEFLKKDYKNLKLLYYKVYENIYDIKLKLN